MEEFVRSASSSNARSSEVTFQVEQAFRSVGIGLLLICAGLLFD